MADWSAGYVADMDYIHGYYAELNPRRMRLAFLNLGLASPDIGAACELGFGQGVSVNVHAAASGARWWGCDFLPGHAALARELAASSGADAALSDEAFAAFCARDDLPDFDFVALHGVWSWISDENRAVIVDFLARKLNPGGVVYIGYNAMPGWAPGAPMRQLMAAHADQMSASGRGVAARVDAALDFADRVFELSPLYAKPLPAVGEWLKSIRKQNRHYLAHEYFNRDWRPMDFAEMAASLGPAKLTYAGSASFIEHVDGMNTTPEQSAFLAAIPDQVLRETSRDFIVNRNFRREYWVKGARRITGLEQREGLRRERILLVTPRADVTLKVTCVLGEASLQADLYGALLDALADHKPHTLGEIEQLKSMKAYSLPALAQAVIVLAGKGDLALVQDDETIARARPKTDRLNARLIERSRGSGEIDVLASPVSGGGLGLGRTQQLMLLARQEDHKTPADWAAYVWDLLKAQNQTVLKDGVVLDSEEKALAELTTQAEALKAKLPILTALGVV